MSEIQKSRKLSENVDGIPVKSLKKGEDPTENIRKENKDKAVDLELKNIYARAVKALKKGEDQTLQITKDRRKLKKSDKD
tara:strand:- start:288 stop:527 length:240 start_codon:yes stop_codon:yes gene_type:complete